MYKLFPILLFAYGLAVTTEDIYDNSYALIIGIDKYKYVSNLDYAVKDAESIQDILVNTFDFPIDNVRLLKNEEATLVNIKNSLAEISSSAKENDRVLIYFAGHGATHDLPEGGEMGYLLPIDGKKNNLFSTSIPMNDIKSISQMSNSKHMLFLIDACYSGLLTIGSRGMNPTTPNYIDKIAKDKGRQIITAGGKGEEVLEKAEWGSSAFTLNLKRGLKDGNADMDTDGYITAYELGLFLNKKVTIDSKNQQTPQYGRMTSQEGEFIFVYSKNAAAIQNEIIDEKKDLVLADKEKLQSNDEGDLIDRRNSLLERWRKRYSKDEDEDVYIIAYTAYGNNFSMFSLGSTAGGSWSFSIGGLSSNNALLGRDISSQESISLSTIGLNVSLGYGYRITDEVWLSAGGGILYMDYTWENLDNSTSSKHNLVTPVGFCSIGTRPLPSLIPGLYIGMNISTIFYAPQSYNLTNGIITINNYGMATSPGIEIGFLIPKLLFWPE